MMDDGVSNRLLNQQRFPATRLLWLLVPILFMWSMRGIALGDVIELISTITLSQLILLLGINLLVLLAFALRWWVIVRELEIPLSMYAALRYRMAAYAISYFTPGPQLGGEPVQVYLLSKRSHAPVSVAAASVAIDKLIELVVNLSVLLVGIVIVVTTRFMGEQVGWKIGLPVVGLLVIPVLYGSALWKGHQPLTGFLRRLQWNRLSEWSSTVVEAEQHAARLLHRPAILAICLVISIIGWMALIVEYWLVYQILALSLTPLYLIALMTAARIAILLPIPGGLGTLEASQVWVLGLLAISPTVGISFSIVVHIRDVAFGLLGLWWGWRDINSVKTIMMRKYYSDGENPNREGQ